MLRSHKQSFHCDWTDLSLEGLKGLVENRSDSSALALNHRPVSITFLCYVFVTVEFFVYLTLLSPFHGI